MNSSQRSAGSSKPAAAAWPPNRMNRSAQAVERLDEADPAVAPARGADRVADRRPDDRSGGRSRRRGVRRRGRRSRPATDRGRASPAASGPPATAIAGASTVGTSSSACWPGAWPGSGIPNAARASAIAVRIRSRRVVFAVSSVAASSAACSGVSASSSRAASSASPTRPAALSRGAMTKPTVSRSIVVARPPPRSRSAAIPGRGLVRSRSRPELRDRPVLAHHRRDVRDGPDRREVREVERLGLRVRQLAQEQPGDRERDAAPRQVRSG